MIREAVARPERSAPAFRPPLRVAGDVESAPEPLDAPAPAPEPVEKPGPQPQPDPQPAPAQPTATATLPPHVRAPSSPPGTPDRIPPRTRTEVAVAITGASKASPVTVTVEGGGGGNGSATVDGAASAALESSGTVALRGVDQTDDGKAGNLRLVATQGGNRLAASAGFSVAAYPSAIGFTFFSLMSPATIKGVKVWGARYDLTADSDSGVRGDLDRTKISENVVVKSATGIFKGAENRHSGFNPTTRKQRDHHGSGTDDNTAAGLIAEIRKAGASKSKQISQQLYRFSCLRTGIAEDPAKAPKVPASGFRIQHRTSAAEGKYFMHIEKTGLAHADVAAGAVDDPKEKAAEIKD